MGKSPGKWIKTVLFGKKSSKSYISKKGVTSVKKTAAEGSDLVVNAPVFLDPLNQCINGGDENIELGNDTFVFPYGTVSTDAELAQAATKAQAAFRGYLARRAFKALKGIIRLQALIRGRLVRRRAVATLHCTRAIVRIQSFSRRKDSSVKCTSMRSQKLAIHGFVCKLLAVIPKAMPLSLQYDVVDPNSAWNWLERWSLSHVWTPLSGPKKNNYAKSQRKHWVKTVEIEFGRPKRSFRNVPTTSNADNEPEKLIRMPRKVTNHQVEPLQEQPQNEIERVKRNLRRVSTPAAMASERSEEAENEVELSAPVKTLKLTAHEGSVDYSRQIIYSAIEVDKSVDVCDHPAAEQMLSKKGGNNKRNPALTVELSSKDDQTNKENQRNNQRNRRKSLPAKQECTENILQKTQSLPSYMAATVSAKAKLKLQAHGEGGNRINKSLSSSRDEKVFQPGWRR